MPRNSLSKILLFLIPSFILVVLFIAVFAFASKFMNRSTGPAERAATAEERTDVEGYVANFVEMIADDDVASLAVDHSAVLTEFNQSSEFFTLRFQNPDVIDGLLLEQLTVLAEDYEISPETVSIHKVTALKKGRFHVVLKITVDDGWEEHNDYFKLELVRRGSTFKLYDAGYWLYSMSFCEGLYLEEDSARSRALTAYGLLIPDPDADVEAFYNQLDGFDPSDLPEVYQLDYTMAKASCLEGLGRYEEASDLYAEISSRPDQAAAAVIHARCLMEAERYDEIEPALLPYFEQIGRDASTVRLLANAKMALDDLEGAKPLYAELLASSGSSEFDAMEQYITCLGEDDGDVETLREFVYQLGESNPERIESLSSLAQQQNNHTLIKVISDMVSEMDPESPQLDQLKGIQAEMSSNDVVAASHYLAAYEKAAAGDEPDMDAAYDYFYQWLYTVAEANGPLAALKESPLQEEAYLSLVEEYVWGEGATNEWKAMLDHVVKSAPGESWVLDSQGEYAEEKKEWATAVSFYQSALKKLPKDEDTAYLDMAIARNKARQGKAMEVYEESDEKAKMVRILSRTLSSGDQIKELEAFLKATVGDQGVDQGKPFTGNRDLRGEDGLDANELHRMWSDLRFKQDRFEESRKLALNADPDPESWDADWPIERAFACLIGEKKYKQALSWIDEHELHAIRKSEVFVAQKDVKALVQLIQTLREEDDSESSDIRIHIMNEERLEKPPFVKALKAIDFQFFGMEEDE